MSAPACAVVAVTPLAQSAVASAALLWPWMLLWLPAVALPFVIARWNVARARGVSWGPIDIVAKAARRQGLSRAGFSWPLVIMRALMLLLAVVAAARPLVGPSTAPAHAIERIAVGTGRDSTARRILLVEPDRLAEPQTDTMATPSPVRQALVALARSGGFAPTTGMASDTAGSRSTIPTIDAIASRDLAATLADREFDPAATLVILTDGAAPLDAVAADGTTARLEQVIRDGGSVLVLLGPHTVTATGPSAVAAWLEPLSGVVVGAPTGGAGARVEVDVSLAGVDPSTATAAAFVVLNGPSIHTYAALEPLAAAIGPKPAVLARTVPAGEPLIVECRIGLGRVCIAAIPCAAPGQDAWSDMAAWPAFVPLIDGLTTRLLGTADASEAHASRGSVTPRVTSKQQPLLPPARVLLAVATALAILEPLASWLLGRRGAPPTSRRAQSHGSRWLAVAAIPSVLLAMLLGAGNTTTERADHGRDVAFLVDVSPSMATEDVPPATHRTTRVSRLQAVRDGLTTSAAARALAALRSANHGLSFTAVGDEILPLDAAGLATLSPLAPRPNASPLGDAVIRATTRAGLPPAAVVVASDGAITHGAAWAEAARVAAAHDTPLIAIPVGDRGTLSSNGDDARNNFRISAAAIPRVAWRGERRAIEITATGDDHDCENVSVVLSTRAGTSLATGLLSRRPLDPSSPAADTVEYTGRLTWTPEEHGQQTLLVRPDRVADDASVAIVGSTLVMDEPVRVLLVDAGPRFEFRFVEHLLAGDRRFRVESCLLDKLARGDSATGADAPRLATPLPTTVADWCRFDVIVLGDVIDGDLPDDAASSLLEACRSEALGIAWTPGRRWRGATATGGAMQELLPASPPATVNRSDPTARRLHILPAGWESGWFPTTLGESTGFGRRIHELIAPIQLRPTARVLAIAEPLAPAHNAAPAVVIDRHGAATILTHLFETWRLRDGAASDYAAYWRNAILRLAEHRLLPRLVPALIDLRPQRPVAGAAATVSVVATRPRADASDWRLEHRDPFGKSERLDLAENSLQLANLAAGWHSLRLIVPQITTPGNERQAPTQAATLDFFVAAPPIERAGPPARTRPMLAAAEASGGAVLPLDDLPRLAETIDRVSASRKQAIRARETPSPLANLPVTNLLMLALLAACVWEWTARVRGGKP